MELVINNGRDRENVVVALANAGYGVKVEERERVTAFYERDFVVMILLDPVIPEWKNKKDN